MLDLGKIKWHNLHDQPHQTTLLCPLMDPPPPNYNQPAYAHPTMNHPLNVSSQPHAHLMQGFWQNQMTEIENGVFDFKQHQLPLARIKKVMKTDEDVKVILPNTSFIHLASNDFSGSTNNLCKSLRIDDFGIDHACMDTRRRKQTAYTST